MASLAPSLNSLRSQANRTAPRRSKAADGWIGDAAHSSRTSDHNPDHLGIVRAIDLTDDPANGFDARGWAEMLRLARDPRLKYVISEGQMFSAYATPSYPAWTWRAYSGPNGHFHHVHVSVKAGIAGSLAGDWYLPSTVGAPVRPPITTSPAAPINTEEADLAAIRDELVSRLDNLTWITLQIKGQTDDLDKIEAAVDVTRWAVADPEQGLRTALAAVQVGVSGLLGAAADPTVVDLDAKTVAAELAELIPDNLAEGLLDALASRIAKKETTP